MLVGMKFSIEEKKKLCKSEPCQLPESVLSGTKKKVGQRNRYCLQTVFSHEVQTRGQWLSYLLSKDCLFCLPCLLFSDECLRGKNMRHNQGNAFMKAGYLNWKKQYSNIAKHKKAESHMNAKELLNSEINTDNVFMASFDIASLFTNISVDETIEIISNHLFANCTYFEGFDRLQFIKLLSLSVKNCHFILNGHVYQQVDGVAMGSPLGPLFANIFMSFHEKSWLHNCPSSFKPLLY